MFPWWQLMLWSLALAFLGVFIAVPLRTQTVIKVRRPQVSSALRCSPAPARRLCSAMCERPEGFGHTVVASLAQVSCSSYGS